MTWLRVAVGPSIPTPICLEKNSRVCPGSTGSGRFPAALDGGIAISGARPRKLTLRGASSSRKVWPCSRKLRVLGLRVTKGCTP